MLKIFLNKNFIFGNSNISNLTDFQYLTVSEKDKMVNTLCSINHLPLCGSNKNTNRTPNSVIQKLANQYNIKHYHLSSNCNPIESQTCSNYINCLNFINIKDCKTSSAIIHYSYNTKNNSIIIFGYSRVHDQGQFPKINIAPLVNRLQSPCSSIIEVIDFENYYNFILKTNATNNKNIFNYYEKTLLILKNSKDKYSEAILFYKYIEQYLNSNKYPLSAIETVSSDDINHLYQNFTK